MFEIGKVQFARALFNGGVRVVEGEQKFAQRRRDLPRAKVSREVFPFVFVPLQFDQDLFECIFRAVDVRVESESERVFRLFERPVGGLGGNFAFLCQRRRGIQIFRSFQLQAQRLNFRQKREIFGAHFVA